MNLQISQTGKTHLRLPLLATLPATEPTFVRVVSPVLAPELTHFQSNLDHLGLIKPTSNLLFSYFSRLTSLHFWWPARLQPKRAFITHTRGGPTKKALLAVGHHQSKSKSAKARLSGCQVRRRRRPALFGTPEHRRGTQ